MSAGRFGMDGAASTRGKSRCRQLAPRSVGSNHRASHDDGPRQSHEVGDRDHRRDRGGVAPPIEARAVIHAFHAMIRKRAGEELAPSMNPRNQV